ncbi:serine/threonine-protein kinase [Streptomyces sp. NPDC048481]|uniref:serine/threonine-protein kinase n=1 Tax=Streptomyces sp. NPDC048481 TaxID=3365557 RepID=UPI003714DB9E
MSPQRNTGAGAEAELPEYAGHYRLRERLGSGGMGEVHLARSTSGMKVAVKIVHARFARDPEFRGRFRQEVAAARRVSGAFTAPVVDADPEAERPWMATLFIPGSTLAEQVKRNGSLNSGELRRLMAGLAEALRDIHRVGVVHRDLKPSNVLLADDGPKVIDFGISRPKDSELRTETGKLIGTPPFMAPEQFRRPREVGPAADVFALGSVMVHAATGRGPFDSDSPYVVAYQVVHDEPDLTGVPDNLAPLVSRCLAKEPEERPTPDELMRELRSVAASYDTQSFLNQSFIPSQRALGDGWTDRADVEAGDSLGIGPTDPADVRTTDVGTTDPAGFVDLGEPVRPGEPVGPAVSGVTGVSAATGASVEPSAALGEPERSEVSEETSGGASAQVDGAGRAPGGRAGAWARGRGGRRRGRVALAAGAMAVVLVGGALGAAMLSDGGDSDRDTRGDAAGSPSASPPFRPWSTRPAKAAPGAGSGAGTGGMPLCATGAKRVLCAQPGLVSALDAGDGHVLWRHALADGDRPAEAPALAGGAALVVTHAGRLVEALAPATGAPRWQRGLSGYVSWRVAGGTLLLTAADGTVTGVAAATGGTLWSHRIPGVSEPYFASFPGDPLAYASGVTDDGHTRITAVDPATGEVRWKARLDGALDLVGTAAGSAVLLSRGGGDGTVDAVVRYDPAGRAARRVRLDVTMQEAQATVHGDRVYLLGFDGTLTAVDTAAGRKVWSLQSAVSRGSAPAADGGHVYFSAADGRLLAVGAADGRLLGQTALRLGAHSDRVVATLPAPQAAGDRVYAGAPDGTVFAVDGRDPARW